MWGSTQSKDTLIVVARRGETVRTPRLVAFMPLGWQYAELYSLTRELINLGFLTRHTTLVGHSLGALLGRKLVQSYPRFFKRIVQIAPTPDVRWSLLLNRSFWSHGGLLALPAATIGLLLPWYGARLPRRAVRGLFAGKHTSTAALDLYQRVAIPDSIILFLQLLLFYAGGELAEAARAGWTGCATLVICPGDTVTSIKTITDLSLAYRKARIPTDTVALVPGTPHAFFVDSDREFANLLVWRKIFPDSR
jgi:pimeloyl-ACP methyl ester carboxylesterase